MKWKSRGRNWGVKQYRLFWPFSTWAGMGLFDNFQRTHTKMHSISVMVMWQYHTLSLGDFSIWRGHSIWGSYSLFITCLIHDSFRNFLFFGLNWFGSIRVRLIMLFKIRYNKSNNKYIHKLFKLGSINIIWFKYIHKLFKFIQKI